MYGYVIGLLSGAKYHKRIGLGGRIDAGTKDERLEFKRLNISTYEHTLLLVTQLTITNERDSKSYRCISPGT
jgi:hypothetical protein